MTSAAIEKNRVTVVLLILILAAGLMVFRGMPRAEDPGFVVRAAMVITYFPGASPERVEMLVSDNPAIAPRQVSPTMKPTPFPE